MIILDASSETPSRNPFPGGYNCKTKVCWILEQVKSSRYKPIVVLITKGVDRPKILRKEMSSPNANDKIRGSL